MLKLNLDGSTDALEKILKELSKAFDTTAILDEAGAVLLNRIRTRFLAEEDPDNVKWIPSKAAIKRRAKGGTGTLFKTGRLFRSIQLAGTGPNQREINTDVPYASKHQLGLDGLPKRVFLGFNENDAHIIERLLKIRAKRILI